ncbi:MAG: KEOPS complex subunit Pcc1 [Candidatus Bathyarchaeota archaeon]
MKLVVFDLDGVLVDIDSSWELIHRDFGTDNEENFKRYLRGEINYGEFMRTDIALWGKVNIKQVRRILDKVHIMKAAPKVVEELKKAGCKTAIISSGISILADRVRETLKIDHSYANKLLTDEKGWLTGECEEIVNLHSKGTVLKRLAEEEGMSLKQCAAIGDSKFDISLFRMAGLSIAFNTRDKEAEKAADLVIDDKDLEKAIPWLTSKNLKKVDSSLIYSSVRVARAVASSISPDNLRTPSGLYVRTWNEGKTVKIKIVCTRRVETMLGTLDDLFACTQVAERAIKAIQTE